MRSLHIATREWPLLAATREKLAPSNKKSTKWKHNAEKCALAKMNFRMKKVS